MRVHIICEKEKNHVIYGSRDRMDDDDDGSTSSFCPQSFVPHSDRRMDGKGKGMECILEFH